MSRRFLRRVAGQLQGFPGGTRGLFDQATAPTGWTRDTGINDRVCRVVSGTRADGGTWTIGGGSLANATLSIAQLPSHDHPMLRNQGGSLSIQGGCCSFHTQNAVSGSTGSGSSHPHTISQDGTWRPLHRDIIAASKD